MIEHKKMSRKNIHKTIGFTLLEVMVAIVIFSIGLLGLAGLMAQSTSFNNSAQYRTQATFLAYDMLDRMRANPSEAANPILRYNMNFGTTAGTTTCYATTCSLTQLATADKGQWLTSVQSLLPNGDGKVTHDISSGTATIFIIEIRWDDSIGGTTSFLLRSEL